MRRQRRPTPSVRLSALLRSLFLGVFLGVFLGLIAAACDAAPSNTPNASPGASPTDVPGTSIEPSDGTGEGQTDTEWGRIWDTLPADFPTPGDAIVADPIDRGPTSGDFSIGAGPEEVKSFYDAALGAAGYVSAVQGPLENGAYVLDSASMVAGCQLQVTITPLSGVTHAAILYGAACPAG